MLKLKLKLESTTNAGILPAAVTWRHLSIAQ